MINLNTVINRRKFIINGTNYLGYTWSLSNLFGCQTINPKHQKDYQGIILCPSSQSKMSLYGGNHSSEEGEVVGYDIDKGKRFVIDVPLGLSHSIVCHPLNPERSLLLEITGDYGCIIDIVNMKAGKRFYADMGFAFSGHGIFSPDGQYIYTCEFNIENPEINYIVKRNPRNLSIISKISTGGIRVHQIKYLPDNKTMIATHYGARPDYKVKDLGATLAFIDTSNESVYHVIKSGVLDRAMCHIAILNSEKMFILTGREKRMAGKENLRKRVVSNNPKELRKIGWANAVDTMRLTSPVAVLNNRDDNFKYLKIEGKTMLFKNALSIQIHPERNIVAITHPEDKLITFWNASNNKFIKKVLTKKTPTGLTISKSGKYFISWCSDGVLYFFNTDNLKMERKVNIGLEHSKSFHNAHIYTV